MDVPQHFQSKCISTYFNDHKEIGYRPDYRSSIPGGAEILVFVITSRSALGPTELQSDGYSFLFSWGKAAETLI
jgi:hypothetical protein